MIQSIIQKIGYSLLIGLIAGLSSAFFLISLDKITLFRIQHPTIIYGLPLAGVLIVFMYQKYGKTVAGGTTLILNEIKKPQRGISMIMAPLVYFSTLLTHLFGGSAGREGTALQLATSLIPQKACLIFKEKRTPILIGISAGFGAIFGTPFAGIFFALEIVKLNKKSILYALPYVVISAFFADFICKNIPLVKHTIYNINRLPILEANTLFWCNIAGICIGLLAYVYIHIAQKMTFAFKKVLPNPIYRPIVAGIIMVFFVFSSHNFDYTGLGIDKISLAFNRHLPYYDFIAKTFFTILTLSAGFKGGEVTPLFYIGATFGNFLGDYLPLPFSFLAGLGFVGLFSGVTKAPFSATILAIELFGIEIGFYAAIVCFISNFLSGNKNIYEI